MEISQSQILETLAKASQTDHKATQELRNWQNSPTIGKIFFPTLVEIFLNNSRLNSSLISNSNHQNQSNFPFEIRLLAIICFKNGIDKAWRRTLTTEQKNIIKNDLFTWFQSCYDDNFSSSDTLITINHNNNNNNNNNNINNNNNNNNNNTQSLAAQCSIACAKIIRCEFPNTWPSAVVDLLGMVRDYALRALSDRNNPSSKDMFVLKLYLNVFNQTIKNLTASRFGKTRSALNECAAEVLICISEIYFNTSEIWITALSSSSSVVSDSQFTSLFGIHLEITHLCLKIIKRHVSYSYDSPNRASEAKLFFEKIWKHFEIFTNLVTIHFKIPLLRKHLLSLTKIYSSVADAQPTSFILLPQSLDVLKAFLLLLDSKKNLFHTKSNSFQSITSQQKNNNLTTSLNNNDFNDEIIEFWQKILIQGLTIFSLTAKLMINQGITTLKYRTLADREEAKVATNLLKDDFFSKDDIVKKTAILLISWYIRLTPTDLEEWENDPETFIQQDSLASWEYLLRPCAERTISILLSSFRGQLDDLILLAVQNATNTNINFSPSSSLLQESNDILAKDAVLNSFGLASAFLCEKVDFDNMLSNTFAPLILNNSSSEYRILRRRICLIISEWVAVKCKNRSIVYEIIKHLLDPSDPLNDIVVKMAAVNALRYSVDEWDFNPIEFSSFLDGFLVQLTSLISSVSLVENKLTILKVLSIIIERVDSRILPYTESILMLLPALWEEVGDENLMKMAILQTLNNLISAAGVVANSPLNNFAILLISECVNPSSSMYDTLLEDAVKLWITLLENSPSVEDAINENNNNLNESKSYFNNLFSLLPFAVNALSHSAENLPPVLKIIEYYALLTPESFVEHITTIFSIFSSQLAAISNDLCIEICDVIYTIASCCGTEIVEKGLVESGLYIRVIYTVYKDDENISALLQGGMFKIIARLSLVDSRFIIQMVDNFAAISKDKQQHSEIFQNDSYESEISREFIMGNMIETWVLRLDNMSNPGDRKLLGLGLTALLMTLDNDILLKLNSILSVWSNLLADINEKEGDAPNYYSEEFLSADIKNEIRNVDYSANYYGNSIGASNDKEIQVPPESAIIEKKRLLQKSDPVHTFALKEYFRNTIETLKVANADSSNLFSSIDPSLYEQLNTILR